MGSYFYRPDGLAVVTQDDGSTLPPLAIDENELEAAGHIPMPSPAGKPPLPPGALANNAHAAPGAPPSRLDAGGGLGVPPGDDAAMREFGEEQALRATIARVAPRVPAQSHGTRAATVPQAGPALAMQNFDGAQPVAKPGAPAPGRADPSRLRRVGGGGAPGEGADPMGGAPRPQLVKGGMRMHSATRQPGIEISPEVRHDLIETDDRPERLELASDDIAAQRRALTAERESLALEQQRELDGQVVQRQAIDREIAKKSKAIGDRDRELDRMKPQTVKEYWKDRGTLAQLGAIFTAAAGGYLQGLTGGARNTGMDMIDDMVNAELAKQQNAYENARERRSEARNEYAQAIEIYGSPEAAALDFQMRRMGAAEKLLQAKAERVGTAEYVQQTAQLAQELRTERAKKRQQLEELERGRFLQENWVNEPDKYVGGSRAPKDADVHRHSADLEKAGIGEKEEQLGQVADLIAELPDGELPTEETRNIVSRGVRGAADLIGGRGTGRELLDSPAERRAVAKVEQIKGKLRHELSGAAVSPQEQERLDAQLDGINTRDGLLRFQNDLARRVERRKAGIRAGTSPEAVLEYERRKAGYGLPERPSSQRVDDQ
jgi:hypothetical protein